MKNVILFILSFAILYSCNKNDSNPIKQNNYKDLVSGFDIALKLKQWSEMQKQKYVVCVLGDTSNNKLYDVGDLVTNLEFLPQSFNWLFTDSLHVDSSMAAGLDYKLSDERRNDIYDSLSLSFTENQMINFLSGLGFKLRMMQFDSLTNALSLKLLEWANYQHPPKIIWSGFHTFIYEGSNSGGYSPAIYTYRGVQNLQFFTNDITENDIQNILMQIESTLTIEQLKNIIKPIAKIKIHDTSGWPM